MARAYHRVVWLNVSSLVRSEICCSANRRFVRSSQKLNTFQLADEFQARAIFDFSGHHWNLRLIGWWMQGLAMVTYLQIVDSIGIWNTKLGSRPHRLSPNRWPSMQQKNIVYKNMHETCQCINGWYTVQTYKWHLKQYSCVDVKISKRKTDVSHNEYRFQIPREGVSHGDPQNSINEPIQLQPATNTCTLPISTLN
jgi:hypothetical protein